MLAQQEKNEPGCLGGWVPAGPSPPKAWKAAWEGTALFPLRLQAHRAAEERIQLARVLAKQAGMLEGHGSIRNIARCVLGAHPPTLEIPPPRGGVFRGDDYMSSVAS